MLLSRHSVALVLSVIASASGMPPAGPVVDQALFSRANTTAPKVFGILLFKGFTPLDIFGPIEALQAVARRETLKLYLLSDTLDPVTTEPAINTANSSFFPLIVPTHTFANAPQLDVLLVPGGAGMRAPAAELKPHTDYIAKVFATVPYFLTVCTGSGLAARAGVLDGRYATTNKIAFNQMRTFGPNVKWVAPARWVIDGHVWTSSGVCTAPVWSFCRCEDD